MQLWALLWDCARWQSLRWETPVSFSIRPGLPQSCRPPTKWGGGGGSNSSQWMNKKIKQAQLSEGSSDRMQNYTVWTLSVPLPPSFCWSPPSKAWTWCLCPLCRTKCSGALQWDLVPSRRRSASSPWHGRRTALHPQPPPPLPYFLWASMIKCSGFKKKTVIIKITILNLIKI